MVYKYNDYNEYVKSQTEAYNKKITWSGVGPEVIREIKKRIPSANSILCHGTRNGSEQFFFKQYYWPAYVIGTEIGEGCEQFPDTIQWDFHDIKKEWVNRFDVIYTNAFDHALKPQKALGTWWQQLKINGSLIIEFHVSDVPDDKVDCNRSYTISETDNQINLLGGKIIEEWKSPKFTVQSHPDYVNKSHEYLAGFNRVTKRYLKIYK